jgi:hypothetical protein
LFENFSENSLKGDLPYDTTLTPPLFSLVNTFKSGLSAESLNFHLSQVFFVDFFRNNLGAKLKVSLQSLFCISNYSFTRLKARPESRLFTSLNLPSQGHFIKYDMTYVTCAFFFFIVNN